MQRQILLNWLRRHGPVVILFLLLTWLTGALLMGDTFVYVDSILTYDKGAASNLVNPFWDFGHLSWRPLGWVFFRVFRRPIAFFVGSSERAQVAAALITLSWGCGLAALLLARGLMSSLTNRELVGTIVTCLFLTSYGFINYAQTGASYVPGLASLLLGAWALAKNGGQDKRSTKYILIAAVGLAGSVCFWFPYILVVPAALLIPILIRGFGWPQWQFTIKTAVATGVFMLLAYGIVIAILDLRDLTALREWMAASSHGYKQTGILRSIFGFSRSFINMGNDGLLFKRYLLNDPYSPVTFWDLFRISLWKLSFFYFFLMYTMIRLLRTTDGRRVFTLFLIAAVPVFIFAMFIFEGGLPERYLALYPFLLLAVLYAVNSVKKKSAFMTLTVLFVAVATVSDFQAMSQTVLRRQQQAVVSRIAGLEPRLKRHSVIVTVHLQDELTFFSFTFPFHPLNQEGNFAVYSVLEPGADRVLTWRRDFAHKALIIWDAGGDVWLSKRLFQLQPRPEFNWVEGDDRRVSWGDLAPFFSRFELGEAVGNEDGFVLLRQSEQNRDLLGRISTTEASGFN